MFKIRECYKLNVYTGSFEAILSGNKTFEICRKDHNFQVGDTLMLLEWSPETQTCTGLFANYRITYKQDGGQLGLDSGYCCLGIAPIDKAPDASQEEKIASQIIEKDRVL